MDQRRLLDAQLEALQDDWELRATRYRKLS
jgi:hypothetical protein